jgi:hypothetical protein
MGEPRKSGHTPTPLEPTGGYEVAGAPHLASALSLTVALGDNALESPVLLTQPGPQAPTLGAGMGAGRPAATTVERGAQSQLSTADPAREIDPIRDVPSADRPGLPKVSPQ